LSNAIENAVPAGAARQSVSYAIEDAVTDRSVPSGVHVACSADADGLG
jgi:hypothetical protein